jgi:hypothetical protein
MKNGIFRKLLNLVSMTLREGHARKMREDAIEELGRQKGRTMREIDKLAKDRKGFSIWTEDPDTGR